MLRLIPNILTLGRLVLAVVFLTMILCSGSVTDKQLFLDVAFVLFVITGLTDLLDGLAARKLGVTSKFGRLMDPLADKVLVCGAFICFAIIGEPKLFNIPKIPMSIIQWSIAAVIILRELYVTILRHAAEARGINFAATFSGKIKMCIQAFAIGTIIIKMSRVQTAMWGYWFTTITLAVTLFVTILSGIRATQRSSGKITTQ